MSEHGKILQIYGDVKCAEWDGKMEILMRPTSKNESFGNMSGGMDKFVQRIGRFGWPEGHSEVWLNGKGRRIKWKILANGAQNSHKG